MARAASGPPLLPRPLAELAQNAPGRRGRKTKGSGSPRGAGWWRRATKSSGDATTKAADKAAAKSTSSTKTPTKSSTKTSAKTSAKTTPKATPKASTKPRGADRTKGSDESKRPKDGFFRVLLRVLTVAVAFVFMVGFAVVLARLTLQPSPASEALTHTNLHPGRSLMAYLDQPELRDAVKQIGGNLLLGVPFGVLVPVVAPGTRGVLRVLLLTATVMLLVEFAQGAMITGRAFDIDDVILNTTGALVGYLLLGRRVSRAVHVRNRAR